MFDNVLYRAFGLLGIFFLISEMTSGICENTSALFRLKEITVCYHKIEVRWYSNKKFT